jgi:shikimate kinase
MIVFLCGLSGSGKSTIGPLLAARIGVPFADLDREIERVAGRSVAELFEQEGEAAFRDLEAEALVRATQLPVGVVALGGGALGRAESLARVLAAGALVWLDASVDVLVARLRDGELRPLLAGDPRATLEGQRALRAQAYGRAQLHIDTSAETKEAVVERICSWLSR